MRKVPEPLYSEVFDLSIELVNASERNDTTAEERAFMRLNELHALHMSRGTADPFLTEALADFTEDDRKAVWLYRVAIEQQRHFPGEPLHTKQIDLASRLIKLGDHEEAKGLLLEAIQIARNLKDTEAIDQAEDLLTGFAN